MDLDDHIRDAEEASAEFGRLADELEKPSPTLLRARLATLLAELELQVENARRHEAVMAIGAKEAESWSDPADRDWVIQTAREATEERVRRETQLAEVAEAVARASEGIFDDQ